MIHKTLISIVMLGVSLPCSSVAQAPLSTQKQKFSYAMGFRVVTQVLKKLEQTGVPLDASKFDQGIQDALSGSPSKLSVEEIQAVIQVYQTQQFVKQATVAMTNKRKGESFRGDNRNKDGVIETSSGLQYRVLEEGVGDTSASINTVVVHYRGMLVNGEEFDSSYTNNGPVTLDLKEVVSGWKEALQLMQKGAKWELVIPPELAYGAKGSGNIGPNETLIYEVKLINVK